MYVCNVCMQVCMHARMCVCIVCMHARNSGVDGWMDVCMQCVYVCIACMYAMRLCMYDMYVRALRNAMYVFMYACMHENSVCSACM